MSAVSRNGTVVNDDGEEQVDVYIEVSSSTIGSSTLLSFFFEVFCYRHPSPQFWIG